MDRGYDDNKIFLKLDNLKQDYVIRIKANRKLMFHNKWLTASELCSRRKGKIKYVCLVLVYGITQHPMMLITNKEISSKEDVTDIAMTYFSRWRIEEYFRCKKQVFRFENFRVRRLAAINSLNFYITLCMAFLAHMSMKPETNALKASIIRNADPIKEKFHFCYYRLEKGICGLLSYAKQGIRLWFGYYIHCFNSKLRKLKHI